MKDPLSTSDLEQVIRRTVEQAVRDAIAEQMPAIRAYAEQQVKHSSPLAKMRKRAGINQADLAEVTGLSQSSISRIESGQLSVSLEQARALATAIAEGGNLKGVRAADLARAIWLVHGDNDADTSGFLDAELGPAT
jgi:DNA-binding XRE family transcriptional regulator